MNDEQLLAVTEAAFLDEFEKIKEAGILGTGWRAIRGVVGGNRSLGSLWKQTASAFKRGRRGSTPTLRQSMAGQTVGGRTVRSGQLARRRAAQAAEAGDQASKGGIMSGIREAIKTPGGAALATAGGGLGAGYVAHRAFGGGGPRR